MNWDVLAFPIGFALPILIYMFVSWRSRRKWDRIREEMSRMDDRDL